MQIQGQMADVKMMYISSQMSFVTLEKYQISIEKLVLLEVVELHIFLLFKIYGQIKNRYPMDTWQEIIGNCDFRLCLGVADILTAEYFSDLIGVATAETESLRKEASIEGELEYGQKNISTLKRNLLNPDEILRLPYNQLLVNIHGNKPVSLEKMIYTEHSLAKKLKDVSVSEYKPNWNKQEEPKPKIKTTQKVEIIYK